MRVYLAMTLPALARAHTAAGVHPDGAGTLPAFAVTPAVQEWYVTGDLEELEYVALTEAARACLPLLAADPDTPSRRVVLAADVPDAAVTPWAGGARSAVEVSAPVPLSAVASVHLDEPEAEGVVAAAVGALAAAQAGDDDARFLLDEAEGCDLLWYDVTEIPQLV